MAKQGLNAGKARKMTEKGVNKAIKEIQAWLSNGIRDAADDGRSGFKAFVPDSVKHEVKAHFESLGFTVYEVGYDLWIRW